MTDFLVTFIIFIIIIFAVIWVVFYDNFPENPSPELVVTENLKEINSNQQFSFYSTKHYHLSDHKALVVYGTAPSNILYWSGAGYNHDKSCTNIIGCTNDNDFVLILCSSVEGFEIVRKELKLKHQCLTTEHSENSIFYHLIPDNKNDSMAIVLKFVFREKIKTLEFYSKLFDLKNNYHFEKLSISNFKGNSERDIISEELHINSMKKTIEKHLKIYKTISVYPRKTYHDDILEFTSDIILLSENKKLFITAIDHCSSRKAYFSCVHVVDENNQILNTWITGDHKNSFKNKSDGLYTHLFQTSINTKFRIIEQIYMDPKKSEGFFPNINEILPIALFISKK